MYIPVPSRNNFILILIVGIPNEPLEIIISDTRETLHTRCHISINGPAHTSCQSSIATRCCSHKLSSNCNICQYTQPLVGRTGPEPGSHNIIP
ncbi:Uncharacterized protein 15.0 kDa protein in GTA-P79 intergenic region [Gossypium arboreum]|uniref:Uncharacterized protein 15.0 kDa protein in GTA-P79 intergenic region n=1 Tax=Gossypium arboreum TaxID=29729 RepID=A0A0B0Q149_GOSAR|nr:Uncharacterized protein 15.0 kDa protein in GTA-P79 intergenic region [Gossypium arboreum]